MALIVISNGEREQTLIDPKEIARIDIARNWEGEITYFEVFLKNAGGSFEVVKHKEIERVFNALGYDDAPE